MKNPLTNEEIIAQALRGELRGEDLQSFQKCLEQDPALRSAYQKEQALEEVLRALPNVPIGTNFTNRVLEEVRASEQPTSRVGPGFGPFRFRFVRVATATAAVTLMGALGLQQYRKAQRSQMAQSLSAFTEVASVIGSGDTPPPAMFQDFEAIQKLSLPREPELDMELLLALQK